MGDAVRNGVGRSGGVGDDGAAVTVTDEDDLVLEPGKHRGDVGGVAVQITERERGQPVTREIDRVRGQATSIELGLQRRPTPRAEPGAVHEQDRSNARHS